MIGGINRKIHRNIAGYTHVWDAHVFNEPLELRWAEQIFLLEMCYPKALFPK